MKKDWTKDIKEEDLILVDKSYIVGDFDEEESDVVPIVLYNGTSKWTANQNFKECISGFELFGTNILDFEYNLLSVNDYSEEELLSIANLVSSVFLMDQDMDIIRSRVPKEDRQEGKQEGLQEGLEKGLEKRLEEGMEKGKILIPL